MNCPLLSLRPRLFVPALLLFLVHDGIDCSQVAGQPAVIDVVADDRGTGPIDRAELATGRHRLSLIRFPQPSFTFTRLRYDSFRPRGRGGSWSTDYPDADLSLIERLAEWTDLSVVVEPRVARIAELDVDQTPFVYLSEPGGLVFSDQEVRQLREYLSSGGFLMADDFWGAAEWQNLRTEMRRVFPDHDPIDLPLSHPIFQSPFRFAEKPQVCSIMVALQGQDKNVSWEREDGRVPHYWGLVGDDDRLMAVFCHNNDLADGWERHGANQWYGREFSEKRAFPMAINILTYALITKHDQASGQHQQRAELQAMGRQRVDPLMREHPGWIALQERLQASGLKYSFASVDARGRITLGLDSTAVTDLAPLRGIQLDSLDLSHTLISDLTPLRRMRLRHLDLTGSQVRDLTPLAGMPLESLSLSITAVDDLSPLKEAHLKTLVAMVTQIEDLSPLTGQPLTYVDLRKSPVRDLTPLANAPLESLQLEGTNVSDLSPLATTPLKQLTLDWRDGIDVRPLRDTPLVRLTLSGGVLSDVSQLAGLQLQSLGLISTSVRDLAPLESMPLKVLNLRGTQVVDLSPLRTIELESLFLTEPGVDLSGVNFTRMSRIEIPDPATVKHLELLRASDVEQIQRCGQKPIESDAFWRQLEARE